MGIFDRAGFPTVKQSRHKENKRHDDPDAVHQRRSIHQAASLGITQQCIFRHTQNYQQQNDSVESRIRPFERSSLAGGYLLFRGLDNTLFRNIFAQLRESEFFQDPVNDYQQHRCRKGDEVIVHQNVQLQIRVNQSGCRFGKGKDQRVRHPRNQVGRKRSERGNVAHDRTGNRMQPHLQKDQCS